MYCSKTPVLTHLLLFKLECTDFLLGIPVQMQTIQIPRQFYADLIVKYCIRFVDKFKTSDFFCDVMNVTLYNARERSVRHAMLRV